MADAYEEYRIKGMVYEFKSTSSEFVGGGAGSGALGTVIMATNYNSAITPAFLDKKSMENYEHAQSAPPTRSMIHAIESKGKATVLKTMYLRTGPAIEGTDIRMYDIGNFCIATQGMVAAVVGSTIGELWVAYEVEFFKPRYRPGGAKMDHFALRFDNASPTSNNLVGGMITTTPFGSAPRIDRLNPVRSPSNPNNGVFGAGSYIINTVGTDSKVFLPENPGGWYKITIGVKANDPVSLLRGDGAAPAWAFAPSVTVAAVANWNGNWQRTAYEAPQSAAAGTENSRAWMLQQVFTVLPFDATNKPYVAFTITNIPDIANPYTIDIFVEEVNPVFYVNPQ